MGRRPGVFLLAVFGAGNGGAILIAQCLTEGARAPIL